MTSALSNLPLLHHKIRQWAVTRKLTLLSSTIVTVGVVAVLIIFWLGPK